MGCKMKTCDAGLGVADMVTILDEAQIRLDMGQIEKGISDLVSRLCTIRKLTTNEQYKQLVAEVCLAHPIRHYIHQDPYARRSFEKPRGYAGDAVLIISTVITAQVLVIRRLEEQFLMFPWHVLLVKVYAIAVH